MHPSTLLLLLPTLAFAIPTANLPRSSTTPTCKKSTYPLIASYKAATKNACADLFSRLPKSGITTSYFANSTVENLALYKPHWQSYGSLNYAWQISQLNGGYGGQHITEDDCNKVFASDEMTTLQGDNLCTVDGQTLMMGWDYEQKAPGKATVTYKVRPAHPKQTGFLSCKETCAQYIGGGLSY